MSIYRFNVSQLMQVWLDMQVQVEAETAEEALEKCKKEQYDITDSETLYDTMEHAPKVKGEATFEISNEHNELIWNDTDGD